VKASRRIFEPNALELVEEAVHLLRLAPAATLAVYYGGCLPFVLGLLYFCAHASWFRPSGEQLAWGALGLVVLFGVMKAAQAEFCARLMAARLSRPPPAWSWRRFGRVAVAQLRLQPWVVLAGILASLVVVPLGWLYAYGQNLAVLGDEERLHDEAVAQAKLWPAQNHIGLLMVSLLALCGWVNLGAAFLAVPWLANRLLGIENVFGFSGFWFLNTTFLAAVTALTWLAIDPLVKAFYVLRVFHGRARRTGEDLRVELQLARRGRAAAGAATLALVLLMVAGPRLPAAEAAPAPRAAVAPVELDRAIDGVLARPEFRWRLRPPPGRASAATDGPIKRFVREGAEILGRAVRSLGRTLRDAVDWIQRRFFGDRPTATHAAGGAVLDVLRFALYLFIGAAVVLILWVIWLIARQARRVPTPVLMAQAVAAAPDLRGDNVQAAQLPADGWLALAREQAARGEWRLALRALYLATLAQLAAEGLISLARFKTNLDYEREVRRRALSRSEVAARFARRRREFEDVWYGRANADEPAVRAWMAEFPR